jgi:hypothetical protein
MRHPRDSFDLDRGTEAADSSSKAMRIIAIVVACVLAGGVATADGINVIVTSACDSSPGQLDAKTRKLHGEIARRALTNSLDRDRIEVPGKRQLDVSVTNWLVSTAGSRTEVTAEIRIVICDEAGKMMSIVNGRATVIAYRAKVDDLRRQAIAEAIESVRRPLHSQLDQRPNA